MALIAIVDTETSSLDPSTGHLVEVAVAIYSIHHRSLVRQYSTIVKAPSNEAEHVNGIPAAVLAEYGKPREEVARIMQQIAQRSPLILSHNTDFDRPWLPELHKDKWWVCTCNDIDWPLTQDSRSLVNVALAHGLGIASAHRAGADVDLIVRLLMRVAELGHDVFQLINTAKQKKLYMVADTRFDAARNAQAKALGFRFHEADKTWRRKLLPEKASMMPFEVREVGA